MIRRKTQDNVGYIIDTGPEDKEIAFCPKCESRHIKTRLGEKIVMDPTLSPNPTDDDWMQCPKCYHLVEIYNVKYEGDIYSDLEVETNPFEFQKSQILGFDDTLKGRKKGIKRRQSETKDIEIDGLTKDGWEVTSYSQTEPINPNQ